MNEEGSTTTVLVVEEQSLLNTALDLKSLLKSVKGSTKKAIETLVSLLDNNDPKIRLTAAKELLSLQVELAKEINTDQFQRLIADIKLNGNGKKRLVEDDNRPLVDFGTIRQVG